MSKKNEPLLELTPKNFKGGQLLINDLTVVLFYAPWCGHCQNFKPEYTNFARNTFNDGNRHFKVAQIDAHKYGDVGRACNVNGFPTVIIFKHGKPINTADGTGAFTGNRTESALTNFMSSIK
jgi:thioredoxin-like negative regulator of GroEL